MPPDPKRLRLERNSAEEPQQDGESRNIDELHVGASDESPERSLSASSNEISISGHVGTESQQTGESTDPVLVESGNSEAVESGDTVTPELEKVINETGAKDAEKSGAKDAEESGAKDAEKSGAKDAEESGAKYAEESGAKDAEESGAKEGDSKQPMKIQWPWIPLTDSSGREYFYNALTSKTSWTMGESSEKDQAPPTAFSVASAQSTWQTYWEQWQQAQSKQSLSRVVPGLTQPPPSGADTQIDGPDSMRDVASQMAVFIEHFQTPTARQLGRPGRQQVKPPDAEALAYTQGYEEYNIWYGKHLSDRFDQGYGPGAFRREERERATTRCNPFTDAGWTRCDLEPELDRPVICLYFARGACYLGSNCRYYHRLPTAEDDEKLDMLHDIFGRERFAAHRDDMDGVGTFSEDCRTLFIGDLKVNREFSNAEEKTEQLIQQQFGLWGPLEDIKVIRNKNIAFIRYKYRVHAEFAKVAMAEQRLLLDRADDQICVKWAHPGRGSDDKPDEQHAKEWDQANQAMMKRLTSLGYTQDDLECYIRWEIQQSQQPRTNGTQNSAAPITAIYPNTDARINAAKKPLQPLEEGTVVPGDLDELTAPDSQASLELNRMHSVLSRIGGDNTQRDFSVDI